MRVSLALCLLGAVAAAQELVVQVGHGEPVLSAIFSSDGRFVVTTAWDKTARLWDARTGKMIRPLIGHTSMVAKAAISPDGRYVVTAGGDKTVRVWESRTGKEIRTFPVRDAFSLAFSDDGRRLLIGTPDGDGTVAIWDFAAWKLIRRLPGGIAAWHGNTILTGEGAKARLWNLRTGKEIRELVGHPDSMFAAAFSRDGRRALTASGKVAHLWDVASGREIRRFEGHTDTVFSVSFAPDGKRVLTGSTDSTIRLWDAESGKEIRRYPAGMVPLSAAFSPDGRHILVPDGLSALLIETDSGKIVRRFEGETKSCSPSMFLDGGHLRTGRRLWSADTGRQMPPHFPGKIILSQTGRYTLAREGGVAQIWDGVEGRVLRADFLKDEVGSFAISRDQHRIVTGGKACVLWDLDRGRELRRVDVDHEDVLQVLFSPDEKHLLTLGQGKKWRDIRLWDLSTGAMIREFRKGVRSAFSPDGSLLLTGRGELYDIEKDEWLRRFNAHRVRAAAISPDNRLVATAGEDGTVRLWHAGNGRAIRRMEGHGEAVASVRFARDGRTLLTGGLDGSTRLWSVETGKELCRLLGFMDGSWAVIDPDGRYDASHAGDVDGLHWVMGFETIALDQLKERYYDPGLLAKILGRNREPLRDVRAFTKPKLFPSVELEQEETRLRVQLKNRGGGIGRVVVKVNGIERTADARARGADAGADAMELEVDLAGDPRLRPGEANRIEVVAYNAEGYLSSRGIDFDYVPPGGASQKPPEFWAVIAGVSDYEGEQIDLRYAAKDAEDFAMAVGTAASRFFGRDRTHVALRPDVTRQALIGAMRAARRAKPDDVFMLYLAGHGVNHGGQDGDYFYLCAEARSADLKDPEVRAAVAISSRELTDLLNRIPANKRILILDTCASGRVVETLNEKRSIPGSQVRALERLKGRCALHVLAGCAADRVSYETSRYAQGLLTYSLLLGMRGAALRDDEYVDVSKLFQFARDQVEALAKDIGGMQRPVLAAPRGESFDVGRLTREDKAQVPLRTARPLFLRCRGFLDGDEAEDTLRLTDQVDAALREAATGESPIVFVDAREFPDAYRLSGLYTVDGKTVSVQVKLVKGERKVRFTVRGERASLAGRIVEEARRRLSD